MTATYEKLGFSFLYPENWKLIDELDDSMPGSVSVESPDGGAFWSLHVYPKENDPDELLKDAITTMQETYQDLEVTSCEPDLGNQSNIEDGPAIEAMFYCLDFLVRARLQAVTTKDYQLLFWFQAEDRDFESQELVFKAMAISALQA